MNISVDMYCFVWLTGGSCMGNAEASIMVRSYNAFIYVVCLLI